MCQYNNGKLVKAVSIFDVCFVWIFAENVKVNVVDSSQSVSRLGRSSLGPVTVVAVVKEGKSKRWEQVLFCDPLYL